MKELDNGAPLGKDSIERQARSRLQNGRQTKETQEGGKGNKESMERKQKIANKGTNETKSSPTL